MRKFLTVIALIAFGGGYLFAQKDKSLKLISKTYNWTSWGNNRLPKDCPLPLSKTFGGISFTGRYPCAMLMYNDIWYYGTYLLEQEDHSWYVPHICLYGVPRR